MSDAKPMTAEEFAAYRSGEPMWGSSPSEDMRRRLCATIDVLKSELLCAQRRPPHPTGELHVDSVNGKTYECCLCGAVNEPGEVRCFNAAHWGNLEKKLKRQRDDARSRVEQLVARVDEFQVERTGHVTLIETLKVALKAAERT